MSQKKIKNPLKKKQNKKLQIRTIPSKHISSAIFQEERTQKKEDDNAEVVVLITQEKFDLDKQFSYSYMAGIAKELNWKVGRLQKATTRVTQLLKIENKAKEKKNDSSKDKTKNKEKQDS